MGLRNALLGFKQQEETHIIGFSFIGTTKLLYSHMFQEPFYQIEPEFIFEFGKTYLLELSRETVNI